MIVTDHENEDCPVCRKEVSPGFVALILAAASVEPVAKITMEAFLEWLDQIDATLPIERTLSTMSGSANLLAGRLPPSRPQLL